MLREKRRRAKRRKKMIISLVVILLFLAIVAVVAVKGFRIKKVEVQGNKLYDAKTIEKTVLNDKYSWNSLYVYFKYRFVDTKEVPFIDTMKVSLKNPGTIVIQVYEKGIMGYLYVEELKKHAYFDKDGFVVEISTNRISDTIQIKGMNCGKVVLYDKLPIDEERLRQMLTLTQALKRSELIPESITYGGKYEPVLKYGNVQVRMGDLNLLTQKVERMEKIMPSLEGMKGILHLENWTEETTNIIFDKKE